MDLKQRKWMARDRDFNGTGYMGRPPVATHGRKGFVRTFVEFGEQWAGNGETAGDGYETNPLCGGPFA